MLGKGPEVQLKDYCQDSCWAHTLIQLCEACWAGYKTRRYYCGHCMLASC